MSVGQASSNCKALSPAGLFLIMEMEKEEARKKRKNLQRAKYLTVKKRREMKYRVREPIKNYLADFVRQGGGVPPLSAKLF